MRNESKIELSDLDQLQDKREEVRYGFHGLVPACLRGPDGQDMDVVMIDVSRGGLGILTSGFPYRVGDILQFCIEGQDNVALMVRWMRQARLGAHAGLQGLTRVGLAVQKADEDLLKRLEPYNCIDQ